MESLGIELIHANSPQAKGRIERKNRLLQDRLIKEMRLDGIHSMAMANGEYLDQLRDKYNQKFAVPPLAPENIHVPVKEMNTLPIHFTLQEERKVTKNNVISYYNKIFVLEKPDKVKSLHRARVTVCKFESGVIAILYKGQSLAYKVYDKNQYTSETYSRREATAMAYIRRQSHYYRPAADHPWRKCFKQKKTA